MGTESSTGMAHEAVSDAQDRVLSQISHCLRQGCVICLEHAEQITPRFTKWQVWGTPRCYGGDPQRLFDDIDSCRKACADQYIRLQVEDYSFHSRFSFMVHQPQAASAA